MAVRRSSVVIVALAAAVGAAIVGVKIVERTASTKFRQHAAAMKAAAGRFEDAPVGEEDLRGLPEPMARYLRFSGVVGQKPISAVHVLHSGRFKPGVNRAWAPILGEYIITTKKPSFNWYGRIAMAGIPVVAFDSYASGHGRMQVKALSLFPIVDDQSEQVSQSAFGRCVAELTMAPTFFLDGRYVRCVQTGPDEARCTVTDGPLSADADFAVNRDGSLDRVVVMRYFDRGGGKATLERFTGKASPAKWFGVRRLPARFDGIWNLPEGEFHYVSFDVDRVDWE